MTYTIEINPKNANAKAFLTYLKSLDFITIKEEKVENLTDEDRKFIEELSKKTKKAATKRFYAKIGAL